MWASIDYFSRGRSPSSRGPCVTLGMECIMVLFEKACRYKCNIILLSTISNSILGLMHMSCVTLWTCRV